jgi:nucleolar complex protein 3
LSRNFWMYVIVQPPVIVVIKPIYILCLQREPRLDALIQSEDKAGNGVYLPTLDDPELCNPFATSIYELFLYQASHTLN